MNQISRPAAIRRMSLHEEIVTRVRDKILEGEMRPGDWVSEMSLCGELGISRTPLREALKVLASENLVTLLPNRGAMVTEISVTEIAELFEILEPLEELIGRLVVERASDAGMSAVQEMHDAMVAHYRNGRRHAYFDANQAIHRRFAELAGNQSLLATYVNFTGKIRRARYLANVSNVRWSESVAEHEAFMAALSRRDAAGFGSLLRDHSRRTAKVVCAALHAGFPEAATSPTG
jgi:DNA-binding GntR family transcriptional regulator